jgi:hypothetical protein
MIFVYELTKEEEEGIQVWVNRINAKGPAQTTIDMELAKVVKRFLKGQIQYVSKQSQDSVITAYDRLDEQAKRQVKSMLGII